VEKVSYSGINKISRKLLYVTAISFLVPLLLLCGLVLYVDSGNFALVGVSIAISGTFTVMSVYIVYLRNKSLILEKLATVDPLTEIYNRRHFFEMSKMIMERTHRQNTESFIVLFDIDKLKDINDNHGHTIGDKTILEIVNRVKPLIRRYDIFGRYAGDEFILHISESNEKNVMEITERLRSAMCEKKFVFDSLELRVSSSFGVAKVGEDLQEAIDNADIALYRAKENGRNKVELF
jgi:diguanylate cyclase (GGDEF)-like protein